MYRHGVNVREQKTPITPVKTAGSALPVIIGTASGVGLPADKPLPVNELKMIFSYKEFVETFGDGENRESYSLEQAAYIYFNLYRVAPIVVVNVYDPATHGDITNVTVNDIIGGIDAATGERKGLELVEEVFPRFKMIPGQILAPGFSHEPALYPLLQAKAEKNNSFFKSMTIIDLPSLPLADLLEARKPISSPNAILTTPRVKVGEENHWLSNHAAGLIAKRDSQNSSIPYESPSNKGLNITGVEKVYIIEESNYLNGQGIILPFSFTGGWKLWGNRTAAYPATTDLKDSMLPNRRMANWINNTLILDSWQKIDDPMNKRLIDSFISKWQIFLNGQVAAGFLIGGRISFQEEDNPLTDLSDGIIRFRLDYLSPTPARSIEFIVTVDVNYFKNLF